MTDGPVRWFLVVLLALVLIGVIAYARGPQHHRGDDVGALSSLVHPREVGS